MEVAVTCCPGQMWQRSPASIYVLRIVADVGNDPDVVGSVNAGDVVTILSTNLADTDEAASRWFERYVLVLSRDNEVGWIEFVEINWKLVCG